MGVHHGDGPLVWRTGESLKSILYIASIHWNIIYDKFELTEPKSFSLTTSRIYVTNTESNWKERSLMSMHKLVNRVRNSSGRINHWPRTFQRSFAFVRFHVSIVGIWNKFDLVVHSTRRLEFAEASGENFENWYDHNSIDAFNALIVNWARQFDHQEFTWRTFSPNYSGKWLCRHLSSCGDSATKLSFECSGRQGFWGDWIFNPINPRAWSKCQGFSTINSCVACPSAVIKRSWSSMGNLVVFLVTEWMSNAGPR